METTFKNFHPPAVWSVRLHSDFVLFVLQTSEDEKLKNGSPKHLRTTSTAPSAEWQHSFTKCQRQNGIFPNLGSTGTTDIHPEPPPHPTPPTSTIKWTLVPDKSVWQLGTHLENVYLAVGRFFLFFFFALFDKHDLGSSWPAAQEGTPALFLK